MSHKIFIYDIPAPSNLLAYAAISSELERLGGKRIAYSTWEVFFPGSLTEHMSSFFSPDARLIEVPHNPATVTVRPGKYEMPSGLPYQQSGVDPFDWLYETFYTHPTSKPQPVVNALLANLD